MLCLKESENGSIFPLEKFPVKIGRAKENDLRPTSLSVSKNHAVIYKDEATNQIYLKDTGSKHGTRIASELPPKWRLVQQQQVVPLRIGQSILFGKVDSGGSSPYYILIQETWQNIEAQNVSADMGKVNPTAPVAATVDAISSSTIQVRPDRPLTLSASQSFRQRSRNLGPQLTPIEEGDFNDSPAEHSRSLNDGHFAVDSQEGGNGSSDGEEEREGVADEFDKHIGRGGAGRASERRDGVAGVVSSSASMVMGRDKDTVQNTDIDKLVDISTLEPLPTLSSNPLHSSNSYNNTGRYNSSQPGTVMTVSMDGGRGGLSKVSLDPFQKQEIERMRKSFAEKVREANQVLAGITDFQTWKRSTSSLKGSDRERGGDGSEEGGGEGGGKDWDSEQERRLQKRLESTYDALLRMSRDKKDKKNGRNSIDKGAYLASQDFGTLQRQLQREAARNDDNVDDDDDDSEVLDDVPPAYDDLRDGEEDEDEDDLVLQASTNPNATYSHTAKSLGKSQSQSASMKRRVDIPQGSQRRATANREAGVGRKGRDAGTMTRKSRSEGSIRRSSASEDEGASASDRELRSRLHRELGQQEKVRGREEMDGQQQRRRTQRMRDNTAASRRSVDFDQEYGDDDLDDYDEEGEAERKGGLEERKGPGGRSYYRDRSRQSDSLLSTAPAMLQRREQSRSLLSSIRNRSVSGAVRRSLPSQRDVLPAQIAPSDGGRNNRIVSRLQDVVGKLEDSISHSVRLSSASYRGGSGLHDAADGGGRAGEGLDSSLDELEDIVREGLLPTVLRKRSSTKGFSGSSSTPAADVGDNRSKAQSTNSSLAVKILRLSEKMDTIRELRQFQRVLEAEDLQNSLSEEVNDQPVVDSFSVSDMNNLIVHSLYNVIDCTQQIVEELDNNTDNHNEATQRDNTTIPASSNQNAVVEKVGVVEGRENASKAEPEAVNDDRRAESRVKSGLSDARESGLGQSSTANLMKSVVVEMSKDGELRLRINHPTDAHSSAPEEKDNATTAITASGASTVPQRRSVDKVDVDSSTPIVDPQVKSDGKASVDTRGDVLSGSHALSKDRVFENKGVQVVLLDPQELVRLNKELEDLKKSHEQEKEKLLEESKAEMMKIHMKLEAVLMENKKYEEQIQHLTHSKEHEKISLLQETDSKLRDLEQSYQSSMEKEKVTLKEELQRLQKLKEEEKEQVLKSSENQLSKLNEDLEHSKAVVEKIKVDATNEKAEMLKVARELKLLSAFRLLSNKYSRIKHRAFRHWHSTSTSARTTSDIQLQLLGLQQQLRTASQTIHDLTSGATDDRALGILAERALNKELSQINIDLQNRVHDLQLKLLECASVPAHDRKKIVNDVISSREEELVASRTECRKLREMIEQLGKSGIGNHVVDNVGGQSKHSSSDLMRNGRESQPLLQTDHATDHVTKKGSSANVGSSSYRNGNGQADKQALESRKMSMEFSVPMALDIMQYELNFMTQKLKKEEIKCENLESQVYELLHKSTQQDISMSILQKRILKSVNNENRLQKILEKAIAQGKVESLKLDE